MENLFKTTPAPRPDIEREEKVGDCFKKVNEIWDHYYLVREHDVLHVTEQCINTLFDNHLTDARHTRGEKFIPIERSEFNQKLNEEIFSMNIFANEFKEVQ